MESIITNLAEMTPPNQKSKEIVEVGDSVKIVNYTTGFNGKIGTVLSIQGDICNISLSEWPKSLEIRMEYLVKQSI